MAVTMRPRRSDPSTSDALKCWSLGPKMLTHTASAINVQNTVEVPTQKLFVHGSSFASAVFRESNAFTGGVRVSMRVIQPHGSSRKFLGKRQMRNLTHGRTTF